MKSFVKGLMLVAIMAGVMLALSDMPAMAWFDADTASRVDTSYAATDIDTIIQSGIPGDGLEGAADETSAGRLWVTYVKTNGQKTSAQKTGTQYDTYVSDTVLGVPTGMLSIQWAYDNDSRQRQFAPPLEGFTGWVGNNTKMEKLPRDTQWVLPESGETVPLDDQLCFLVIETADTGSVKLNIVNTSNYACSFVLLVNFPDTDFNVGQVPQGAKWLTEGSSLRDRFIVSVGQNADSGNGLDGNRLDTISVQGTVVKIDAHINSVLLAEEAETQLWLRFAADTSAAARDSMSVTVQLIGDTEYGGLQWGTSRHTRIFHDSGYYGDNDTHYGEGGSSDSVSIFVLVATAIVRVKKTDSVFAPTSYVNVTASRIFGDTAQRERDTVPGATIIYEITYDNDGNRRADTVDIIDFLDSNVDFAIDTINSRWDTTYFNTGVDTRMTHARPANADTYVYVAFSLRGTPSVFGETQVNFNAIGNGKSTVETVAAVRIRWNPATNNDAALRRDQIDEPAGNSTATWDPLDRVESCTILTTANSDSGDCGRIRYHVVIR